MCLGHESSGKVVKIGPKVPASANLAVGDRVALEPGMGCRVCEMCKSGKYEVSVALSTQLTSALSQHDFCCDAAFPVWHSLPLL